MSGKKQKPTGLQLFIWSIPTIAAILFTLVAVALHRGVEIGLGAILFGLLYFFIRYGSHTQDSPPQ